LNENLPPSSLRRIALELTELLQNPPEDIKLIPNEDNFTDIQAILTGPAGTPYEGGAFRVKLKLGPDFPQVPPKGTFLTKIFHPNVSKDGEICVNTLKKDWNPDLGIRQLLLTIKCLLIVPNPESALNEEAGRLLLEDYDEYAKYAKLMTNIHAVPRNSSSSSAVVKKSAEKEKEKDKDFEKGEKAIRLANSTDPNISLSPAPPIKKQSKEVVSRNSSSSTTSSHKKSLKRL